MSDLLDILLAVLILLGSGLALISAIGIVRFPDLFTRMHAATKAGTLGVGFVLIALVIDAGDLGVASRAIAVLVFLLITAPVAAHLIGRAAYFDGVELWEETLQDELRGRYDQRTHDA